MTQDEADKELGRIVREALIKGINHGAGCEVTVALDVAGIGPVVAIIKVGRIDAKYIY